MTISNQDNIIDSRDVIERIAHLEQLRQPGPVDLGPEDNEYSHDDLFAELAALEALAEQGESLSDWECGEELIRDSYFHNYAMATAEDMYGDQLTDSNWPFTCINWEQATRELQMDYTSLEFDGVTYWSRS